ncbi:hypothetical protein ABT272_44020 [Streptomyces sp900105245]|uniref:Uncharacterized protein n=1 Tax=Streptomyces sp. 900105245 TaxID=3154379 RepID=A0ABV1ULA2_9ACTN
MDAAATIGELRQLHEEADDSEIERMPDDDEVFKALLYLERRAGVLRDSQARCEAAIKRVALWQYLREQAEIRQANAVSDARGAGVAWTELMPALAVKSPSAAYNKAARLRAVALADQGESAVRRTPEAVIAAERKIAARAAAERQAEKEAERRHGLVLAVAQRLVRHRDGLNPDEDVAFWLEQIEDVLPDCRTATQIVSLGIYVKAVVRELKRIERTSGTAANTEDAQLAYTAAVALIE